MSNVVGVMNYSMVARRLFTILLLLALAVSPTKAVDTTYTEYREDQKIWIIGNPLVEISFQLDDDGRFHYTSVRDKVGAHSWRASEVERSSPVNLTVDGISLDDSI